MKLVIMLIVMSAITTEPICPMVTVASRTCFFTGRVDYPKQYDGKAFERVYFNFITRYRNTGNSERSNNNKTRIY
jgi:hypothetical protein